MEHLSKLVRVNVGKEVSEMDYLEYKQYGRRIHQDKIKLLLLSPTPQNLTLIEKHP